MMRDTSIEPAATPAGVVFVPPGFRVRGWRRAQPPANGWHPSGMTVSQAGTLSVIDRWCNRAFQAGGLIAISRWSSEERATPPESNDDKHRIPEGCQP